MDTNLKFIIRLKSDSIIALLNYCLEMEKCSDRVNAFYIKGEKERVNHGENFLLINAYNNNTEISIGDFILTDTSFYEIDHTTKKTKKDYGKYLKEFLTVKFGEEYIKYNYEFGLERLNIETNKLITLLNNTKSRSANKKV